MIFKQFCAARKKGTNPRSGVLQLPVDNIVTDGVTINTRSGVGLDNPTPN